MMRRLTRLALATVMLAWGWVVVAGGGAGASPAMAASAPFCGLQAWMVTPYGQVVGTCGLATAGSVTGPLNGLIVGIAPSHQAVPMPGSPMPGTEDGYWLASAKGSVYTFGGATFFGSITGHLNAPIVAILPHGTTGYYLIGADGGVFTFGDAPFLGSLGGTRLNQPIVAAASMDGGYVLVAADGGVFTFGGAPFLGSGVAVPHRSRVVGIGPTPAQTGYWLAEADGSYLTFGTAPPLTPGGGSPTVAFKTDSEGEWFALSADGLLAQPALAPQTSETVPPPPWLRGPMVDVALPLPCIGCAGSGNSAF
jgi:hypothetical protein